MGQRTRYQTKIEHPDKKPEKRWDTTPHAPAAVGDSIPWAVICPRCGQPVITSATVEGFKRISKFRSEAQLSRDMTGFAAHLAEHPRSRVDGWTKEARLMRLPDLLFERLMEEARSHA